MALFNNKKADVPSKKYFGCSKPVWITIGVIFFLGLVGSLVDNPEPTPQSTIVQTAQPTTQPEETAAPTADNSQHELNGSVRYSDTAFLITNNEGQEWKGCKLEVNAGLIRGGYVYKASSVPAKDSLIIPFREFTKGDGTRLNPDTTKPQNISISCDDVAGKRGFNYFTIN